MNMKDVSKVKDVVKGGCKYVWSYQKSANIFINKTTRSKCPEKKYNGVVTEIMVLKGNKLTYEFASREERFKCQYKKSIDIE